jgi:hypothetical protein
VNRRAQTLASAGAINLFMIALAFAVAPRSCEGGFGWYFLGGVAAVVALVAVPFVTRTSESIATRFGVGIGFALFGVGVWFAGLFVANVRFICRLF